MTDNTLISRVRKLTPEQLDAELSSHDNNEMGRHIILQEKTRRAIAEAARPNWMVRASLVIALIAAVFAGISALPEIRSWHRADSPPSPTAVVEPDYGPPPSDACREAAQRFFGPDFALELTEPKQASVDDPDHPGVKIHGWVFEASGNFKPPSKSNFPMAVRFLTHSDSFLLYGSPYGPWERWGRPMR
jgi:hypothetical protein